MNLHGADLRGADLRGAALQWADLREAKVKDTHWPSPTEVLLADWGGLSDNLTLELMRFDAACHPRPETFDEWAESATCPYSGGEVARAASFIERRRLWSPGPSLRPYELMRRVLEECCVTEEES